MRHTLFFFALLLCSLTAICHAAKAASFVDPLRHSIISITPKTFDGLISRFRNSNGVSGLLHYKSKKPSDKQYIDNVYNEAAKSVKGIVRLAAIDCDKWAQFCKENFNPDLKSPLVVLYPPNPLPPQVLTNNDKDSIKNIAFKMIPGGNIIQLNKTTLPPFLSKNAEIPKVILFSARPTLPVIFKALSNAFADRLSFGLISAEETELMKKYKIASAPAFLLFRAGAKLPEVYNGDMTYDAIHAWVNVYAETFVKGGGFSVAEDKETVAKSWLSEKIPEVTGASHQDICFRGSNLCAIFLSRGPITQEETAMLEELSDDYPDKAQRGPKFRWMWMNIKLETNFQHFFRIDVETAKLPTFAVINPHKRLRYVTLPSDRVASKESMKELIEKIAAGDGRFTMVKEPKIPSFTAREANTPSTALPPKEEL